MGPARFELQLSWHRFLGWGGLSDSPSAVLAGRKCRLCSSGDGPKEESKRRGVPSSSRDASPNPSLLRGIIHGKFSAFLPNERDKSSVLSFLFSLVPEKQKEKFLECAQVIISLVLLLLLIYISLKERCYEVWRLWCESVYGFFRLHCSDSRSLLLRRKNRKFTRRARILFLVTSRNIFIIWCNWYHPYLFIIEIFSIDLYQNLETLCGRASWER